MKRALSFLAVLVLLFPQVLFSTSQSSSGCCTSQLVLRTLASTTTYVDVNVSEAKQMIESNPNLVILDVRTLQEYESGRIQNATFIPLTELPNRLGELNKEKEILVYCKSGGRSTTASQMLVDNGFSKVYNILDGITAWRNAGYWIEIVHDGDLIIDGTQTFVIENCTYIQTGDIHVRDNGVLIVHNSSLSLNQTYGYQFGIQVGQSGHVEMEFVDVISPKTFSITLTDFARFDADTISTNGCLECHGGSLSLVSNSTLDAGLVMGGHATAIVSDSSKIKPEITLDFRLVAEKPFSVEGLKPGFLGFWNTHINCSTSSPLNLTIKETYVNGWELAFSCDIVGADVKNSVVRSLWLDFSNEEISLSNVKTGFYDYWNMRNIRLINSSITEQLTFILSNVNATFSNCTIHLHLVGGFNKISVENSTLRYLISDWGDGTVYLDRTVLEYTILLSDSNLHLGGNVTFEESGIGGWVSANVTRNYNVVAMNMSNRPVENASLTLIDRQNNVVWNGTTASLGRSNLNLTFNDSNCTDALRLEAAKGNLTGTAHIGFLTDTPVVLKMRYLNDLNHDGTVNILDIFIVAKAFGSKPGDENWNVVADLNKDNVINILDVFAVANGYGKTV